MTQNISMNNADYESYLRQQKNEWKQSGTLGGLRQAMLGQSLAGQIQGGQQPQQPYSLEPETRSNDELLLLLEDLPC